MNVKRFIYAASAFATVALSGTMAQAGSNTFSFGVEGFNNQYKETDADITESGDSGSVTGYFSHQWGRSFAALDGRVSYGAADLSSAPSTANYPLPSGDVSNVPQWELEMRLRYGRTYQVWDGNLSPYIGIGARYTRDEGKGYLTNALGAGGDFEDFDTNTVQFYVPIGATYSQSFGNGWSINPLAEADIMFYGDSDQHLTNISYEGTFNESADNTQHFGLGGRGEFMIGTDMGGWGLEFGPFIRYWWIQRSDSTPYHIVTTQSALLNVGEPSNTSTEIGGALRILW